jgi:pimeloyl-ACP methyl ester carboxylesterase
MERVPARVLRFANHAFFRTRYRRSVSEPIIAGGFWSAGGAQALRTIIGRRYLDRFARLWTPVTIVNGTFDPVFGPGSEPWASAARRGRHVLIAWALHLSNLDRPATFSRIVAEAAEDALAWPATPD